MRRLTCALGCVLALAPAARAQEAGTGEPGSLVHEWKLGERNRNLPSGQLYPHRPAYVILRVTDDVNDQPTRVPEPQGFQSKELKMQIGFRGELASPAGLDERLRLWYAYTQQSNWQAFNEDKSRPFRDTNHEPEMILTIDTRADRRASDAAPPSWRPALVNLGVTHQSNGRSFPESRTWWRAYLQGGWQTPAGSLLARVWHTFRESGLEEDNPDITSFVGRMDVVLRTRNHPTWGGLHLLLRSSLREGPHRGFVQADWRLPRDTVRFPLHVQLTYGYGESLLDYNHKQATIGFGVAFWHW